MSVKDSFRFDPLGDSCIIEGENLEVLRALPDEAFTVIYLDPPFNTGRAQVRRTTTSIPVPDGQGDRVGFSGRSYETVMGQLRRYDDSFADYLAFLEPRLLEARRLLTRDGTLYLHLDYREVHYAKIMLDALFGRASFLNEIIWAYDFGGKSTRKWPSKHDTILVYVKDPKNYHFDSAEVDGSPIWRRGWSDPRRPHAANCPRMSGGTPLSPPPARRKPATPPRNPWASCGA